MTDSVGFETYYEGTFEGMEYSFEGSATTKIWILTGSRTFLE